jgi:hypothetical protein
VSNFSDFEFLRTESKKRRYSLVLNQLLKKAIGLRVGYFVSQRIGSPRAAI